jgi:hypothetical protein
MYGLQIRVSEALAEICITKSRAIRLHCRLIAMKVLRGASLWPSKRNNKRNEKKKPILELEEEVSTV